MELLMFMHENYLCRHSVNDLSVQSLWEYFSYLSIKFTSFSLVKTRPVCNILLSDESDDSTTVHDLDERRQLSLDIQRDQQHRNINRYRRAFEQFYKNNHCLTNDQELTNHQSLNQTNSPDYINNHSHQLDSRQDLAINNDSQPSSFNANDLSLQSKVKPRSTAVHNGGNQKWSLRHKKSIQI